MTNSKMQFMSRVEYFAIALNNNALSDYFTNLLYNHANINPPT